MGNYPSVFPETKLWRVTLYHRHWETSCFGCYCKDIVKPERVLADCGPRANGDGGESNGARRDARQEYDVGSVANRSLTHGGSNVNSSCWSPPVSAVDVESGGDSY